MNIIVPHTETSIIQSEKPRFLAAGDSALVVEFGSEVDANVNARVLLLDKLLWLQPQPGILETVPTYRSLMIIFDPLVQHHGAVKRMVEAALALSAKAAVQEAKPRQWEVPVVYGEAAMADDLAHVAEQCGLSTEEVITLHAAANYRVFMIGFNPGFPYLGGQHPKLAVPRRAVPIPHVEPGRIIVGGRQSAITSVPTPTGWYVIGRTPVRPFDLTRARNPFMFQAGDMIRFKSVNPLHFNELAARPDGGAVCVSGGAA